MPGGNLGPGNFDPTPLPTDPDAGQVEETADTIPTSTAYRVPKNIRLNAIISSAAPRVKNALWIKPVEGGFAIYAKFNGKWQPLKMVDDGGTPSVADDEIATMDSIIGTSEDTPEDNTINGAKALAQSIGNEIVGDETDTVDAMTLHGLKAYIDSRITEILEE